MSNQLLKLGILISGRGSNMQAIIKACENLTISAEVKIVISNKPQAPGLILANQAKIPAMCINPTHYSSFEIYEKNIIEQFEKYKVELIILAGYMKIVGKTLLNKYNDKIMNIHPSLLPAFKGLHPHKKAIEYGVKYSGCTVHFVNEDLDGGPIILQEIVPVLENDTEETLSKRILEKEHKAYPKAIQLYADGKLKIIKNKVYQI